MRSRAGAVLVLAGLALALWAIGRALLREPPSSSAAPWASAETVDRQGPARLASPNADSAHVTSAATASDDRREAAGPELVGFVRSEGDGAPVRDAWATLHPAFHEDLLELPPPLAEAGTDGAGRFAFPWPAEPHTWVSVEPPYGWILTSSSTERTPGGPGGAPLEFRARPMRSAQLEVALFDQRTGEPIPHYLLGLRQGPMTSQLVLSDEHGIARSEAALHEGRYQLLLIDDQRMGRGGGSLAQALEFEAVPREEPIELELPIGPTYLLDLRSPTDLDGKLLNAYVSTVGDAVQLTDVHEGSPVRSELLHGWPWVRFHARWVRSRIDSSDEVLLIVNDQARTLQGEARVEASWGFHATPVRIDLRPTGTLEVDVRDAGGRAVPAAEVSLAASRQGQSATIRSGSDGLARFEGLAAGTYWLHVRHIDFDPLDASAEVATGRTARKKIALSPARVAGTIEGRVIGGGQVANDRGFAASLRLALTSIDGAERGYQVALEFERDGEHLVAPFRFEEVPAGEYRLSFARFDPRLWWPQNVVVRPPASGIVLREVPAGSVVWFRARAMHSTTRETFASGWIWFQAEGCQARSQPLENYPLLVHAQAAIRWAVGKSGYRPRFGTEVDLDLADGFLTAEAALEPGAAIRIDVTGPDGEPLEGAHVFADGERAGSTDALGSFLFERTSAPASLEVRYADWRADLSALDALLAGMPVCAIRLAPN